MMIGMGINACISLSFLKFSGMINTEHDYRGVILGVLSKRYLV